MASIRRCVELLKLVCACVVVIVLLRVFADGEGNPITDDFELCSMVHLGPPQSMLALNGRSHPKKRLQYYSLTGQFTVSWSLSHTVELGVAHLT